MPKGPKRKTTERARKLGRIVAAIRVEGAATLWAVAHELNRRGIPGPGRRPWHDVAVLRLDRAVAALRAAREAQQDRADLRERLRILARSEARLRLIRHTHTWQATAERQRRAVAALLRRRPELAGDVDGLLAELLPGIAEIVAMQHESGWWSPLPPPPDLGWLRGDLARLVSESLGRLAARA